MTASVTAPAPLLGHTSRFTFTHRLTCGTEVSSEVAYELTGFQPIVVLGGISATEHALSSPTNPLPGWWESCLSAVPGEKSFLSFRWLGYDGDVDCELSTSDQAEVLHAVLAHAGVARVPVIVGASYGAMVAAQFAAKFPDLVDHLVLCGGGSNPHPFGSAWRRLQRQVLSLAAHDQTAALQIVRQMAMLSYRSPQDLANKKDFAEEWLIQQGEEFIDRFHPVAYRRLSESIDSHRIDPGQIQALTDVVGFEGDLIAPPQWLHDFALDLPRGRYHHIDTSYGHDAFLKEEHAMAHMLASLIRR